MASLCAGQARDRFPEVLPLGARSMGQIREHIGSPGDILLLRARFLRRSWVRKRQCLDQEFFKLFSVGVRPFLPSLLPGKLAAFFTFDPLVLPNLFLDKMGNSVERIGIHYGRDLHMFLSL
jgi:hypothetical protein